MDDEKYADSLTDIFRTYLAVRDEIEGRFDREVRDPHIIYELIRKAGVVPNPERTVRITGSKGKGTTARLCVEAIREQRPSAKVGLVVSPEEFDHTDRMRIDGAAISRKRFHDIHASFRDEVDYIVAEFNFPSYISPVDYILLIALKWFQEEKVDYTVLEGGRGVQYDGVGLICSRVSIVTSILLEHADRLGPTLEDIAADKLSIGDNSEILVLSSQAAAFFRQKVGGTQVVVANFDTTRHADDRPSWVDADNALARTAISWLLPPVEKSMGVNSYPLESASFGSVVCSGVRVVYEAAISIESIDREFIQSLVNGSARLFIIASLPDDKDRTPLLSLLQMVSGNLTEVALSKTGGYLAFTEALRGTHVVELDVNDPRAFGGFVDSLGIMPGDTVYLVGTQSFIRLVRSWLRTQGNH